MRGRRYTDFIEASRCAVEALRRAAAAAAAGDSEAARAAEDEHAVAVQRMRALQSGEGDPSADDAEEA